MADEPDNETAESTDGEAPEVEAAGEQPVEASETLQAEEAAPAEGAEAKEAPEAEAPETETEAAGETKEAPEGEAQGARADAPAGEPAEQLSPKERRHRTRSRHEGESRPARTPEERHAERLLERQRKAVRRRARRLQERAKAVERRAAAPAGSQVGQLAPVHAPVEGTRRVRQGIVVSDKAEKTITVRIDVARRHRRYEKIVRSSSTLHAHDENNDAHEGDVVRVIESRPLSRTKRWKLVDVVERAR